MDRRIAAHRGHGVIGDHRTVKLMSRIPWLVCQRGKNLMRVMQSRQRTRCTEVSRLGK